MRPTTQLYVSCWHVGVPGSLEVAGPLPLAGVVKHMTQYLLNQPVRGPRFEFRISTKRNEIDYTAATKNNAVSEDIFAELESMMETHDEDATNG